MTAKRKWTNEEEQVLINQVRQHPNNLQNAFKATSGIIGRSAHSIEQRWYGKIRHSETVFMTISPKTKNINTKNTVQGGYNNTERVQLSIWRRILKILGL